jgi:hypothetical protein
MYDHIISIKRIYILYEAGGYYRLLKILSFAWGNMKNSLKYLGTRNIIN